LVQSNVITFPSRARPAAVSRYQALLDLWNGHNGAAADLQEAAAQDYEQEYQRALAAEVTSPEAC
jgi:hypothetical protein